MKILLKDSLKQELITLAEECAEALFSQEPHQIIYPTGCIKFDWQEEEIISLNESYLKTLNKAGNLYAIFTRAPSSSQWISVYVGQRKSGSLRTRICDHLVKKNEQTGAKLAEVKEAVAKGQMIGITFIKIEPEPLRLFIEETIIARHKTRLSWNKHA